MTTTFEATIVETATSSVFETYTRDDYEQSYSDFHKEAYGFRPRHSTSHWTLEMFKREFEELNRACEANEAAEKKAISVIEAKITQLIELGAKDRKTAIKWLADGEQLNPNDNYDMDYLCYQLGVPYGYFNNRT